MKSFKSIKMRLINYYYYLCGSKDIHIDDLKGVEIEGEKLGFKTIIVNTNDKNWVMKILNYVD